MTWSYRDKSTTLLLLRRLQLVVLVGIKYAQMELNEYRRLLEKLLHCLISFYLLTCRVVPLKFIIV